MKTTDEFWAKIEKTDECWNWKGGTDGSGRGILTWQGRREYAYRVAYEISSGKPLNGIRLTQSCKNLLCVRFEHLVNKTALADKPPAQPSEASPVPAAPAVAGKRKRREKFLLPKEKPLQPKETRLLFLLSEFRAEIENMESERNEALLVAVDLRDAIDIMIGQLSPLVKALENARSLLSSPSVGKAIKLGSMLMHTGPGRRKET